MLSITFSFCSRAQKDSTGNQYTISNSILEVTCNPETRLVSVTDLATKKVFVKDLFPDGANGTFDKLKTASNAFGEGTSLVISGTHGPVYFTLYPMQPFLFIDYKITNSTNEIIDIEALNPVSFSIDLGKPAIALKTLGTGGLLAPDKNPGSYVFLTTVDPATRNGVVTGWLTNEKGSGVVFSGIKGDQVVIKTQIDYGHYRLPAGKTEAAETLVIGYFEDARLGEEQFADAIATNQNIILKSRTAVYCTWYDEQNGGAGSESSSIELAKFISANLKPYGLGVLQIDDQWQAGGKYNGPSRGFDRTDPKGGYPNGMSATAQALKQEGLTAGIWWMPFARNHQDPEYSDRQHWFACRLNGKPYETTWGGTSLDLTHPEVQEHVAYIASTMRNWGYNYFKMDGLWTGTVTEQVYINDGYKNDSIGNCRPLFNPLKTQIQAFRDGLKIIRAAAGDDVFLSGCCVSQNMRSFGASIGLVNSMRIGPDFNHDGESIRTGAIRASRLYFLNGRIWWNDPDPSMLRETGRSTVDPAASGIGNLTRARLLPSYVALSGQFFLSSDWLPNLPADRIEIMKRCMASHNGTARPVDAFDKTLPSIWLASDQQTGTRRNVVGLYNWDTVPREIGCTMSWAGLNDKTTYHAFDFWENKPLPAITGSVSEQLASESCRIIAVRAVEDHPVVVSTSQHVTQGMTDLLDERWQGTSLTGTSKIIGGDDYELRIAGLNQDRDWKQTRAEIIDNLSVATIEVLPLSEQGWLRVVIKTRDNQIVKWKITFEKK